MEHLDTFLARTIPYKTKPLPRLFKEYDVEDLEEFFLASCMDAEFDEDGYFYPDGDDGGLYADTDQYIICVDVHPILSGKVMLDLEEMDKEEFMDKYKDLIDHPENYVPKVWNVYNDDLCEFILFYKQT